MLFSYLWCGRKPNYLPTHRFNGVKSYKTNSFVFSVERILNNSNITKPYRKHYTNVAFVSSEILFIRSIVDGRFDNISSNVFFFFFYGGAFNQSDIFDFWKKMSMVCLSFVCGMKSWNLLLLFKTIMVYTWKQFL